MLMQLAKVYNLKIPHNTVTNNVSPRFLLFCLQYCFAYSSQYCKHMRLFLRGFHALKCRQRSNCMCDNVCKCLYTFHIVSVFHFNTDILRLLLGQTRTVTWICQQQRKPPPCSNPSLVMMLNQQVSVHNSYCLESATVFTRDSTKGYRSSLALVFANQEKKCHMWSQVAGSVLNNTFGHYFGLRFLRADLSFCKYCNKCFLGEVLFLCSGECAV